MRIQVLRWGVLNSLLLMLLLPISEAAANPEKPGPAGGELTGQLIQPDGMRPTVQFRYHHEAAGEGRITTRIGAESERFAGEYIRMSGVHSDAKIKRFHLSWSSAVYDGFEIGPTGMPWRRTQSTVATFRERHRGAVIANLIGDRGTRMRCRLDLEDPNAGLPGGAKGACQVSTGQKIKIP